jgi:hypothetical protein
LLRLAWTWALTGTGVYFLSHCFYLFLPSGVWNDTTKSSIMMILPRITIPWFWMHLMKALVHLTLSTFCSQDSSFDLQWADFFTRLSSLCRMWLIVPNYVIWTTATGLNENWLSTLMTAATEALIWPAWTVFLSLRPFWSSGFCHL